MYSRNHSTSKTRFWTPKWEGIHFGILYIYLPMHGKHTKKTVAFSWHNLGKITYIKIWRHTQKKEQDNCQVWDMEMWRYIYIQNQLNEDKWPLEIKDHYKIIRIQNFGAVALLFNFTNYHWQCWRNGAFEGSTYSCHAIEIITSSCSDVVIKLEHTATSTNHTSPAAADSEFTALLENNFYALCSRMHIQVRAQCRDCWVLSPDTVCREPGTANVQLKPITHNAVCC